MLRRDEPGAETLARHLLGTFGWDDDPRVRGILLIGSAAAGVSDPLSDLDIVVVAEPVPSADDRERTYRDAGCTKAMLGFLRSDSTVLPSNVTAIDKVWIQGLQVDVSFCDQREVSVYDHQPFIVLKSCPSIRRLRPPTRDRYLPTEALEPRLSYSFRILLVHRDRYARWCERHRWLSVDLSMFLQAVRDMIRRLCDSRDVRLRPSDIHESAASGGLG